MIHIPVSKFKDGIAEALNQVAYGHERILLQRHGKDVAALISMSELKILDQIERGEEEQDTKEALVALKKARTGEEEIIPWEEAKKRIKRKRKSV